VLDEFMGALGLVEGQALGHEGMNLFVA